MLAIHKGRPDAETTFGVLWYLHTSQALTPGVTEIEPMQASQMRRQELQCHEREPPPRVISRGPARSYIWWVEAKAGCGGDLYAAIDGLSAHDDRLQC